LEALRLVSSFLSAIKEEESYLPKLVSEMNTSGLPLLFYGAGKYAETIYKASSRHNLRISDIIVTTLENNKPEFMSHKVISISEALTKHDKCNVFIAFSAGSLHSMEKTISGLMQTEKISKVYVFDGIHSNYYSETNLGYKFVEENQDVLNDLMNILADDFSRGVLIGYFNQRISGDICYLKNLVTDDQYFPDIIKLKDNEVFVDCGAYDGDSIDLFIKNMGSKSLMKIYAFEPDKKNYMMLLARNYPNLTAIQKGCYSEKTTLHFRDGDSTGSAIDDTADFTVDVDTIDNILQGEKATYIKMDVEGVELAAIEGARNTIVTHKPKLAISVYHKKEDLISIPQLILSLNPNYKLYLRQHSIYSHDTVLYAI